MGGLFGVFAQGNGSTAESSTFSVSLNPGKIYSTSGEAVYKVTITDLRAGCPPGSLCPVLGVKYDLKFQGIGTSSGKAEVVPEVKGEFSENGFYLGPAEKRTITLKVVSGKPGDTRFAVIVHPENDTKEATVYGDLIVFRVSTSSVPEISFSGKGYAKLISEPRASAAGTLVSLNFASVDGTLKGSMNFDNEPYTIEGTYEGQDLIEFDLNGRAMSPLRMHFKGTIENLGGFSLLSGDLTFGERVWHLELTSRNPGYVRDVDVSTSASARVISGIHLKDVISFNDENSVEGSGSASVYVQPVRIERSKILWIIPNPFGKRILVANFIDANSVSEIRISAGDSENIKGYVISADSLNDEENIQIGIFKA
ncbi:MAG: hypothetical protein KKB62_01655 [Nanoarchaeota archaeon]|nr:hypothetical protein [Nanoarchaeota archaeon]